MSLSVALEALDKEALELSALAKAAGDIRSAVLLLRERRELAVLMHPEGDEDDDDPAILELTAIEFLRMRGLEVRPRADKETNR